jgi:hypothetical protein
MFEKKQMFFEDKAYLPLVRIYKKYTREVKIWCIAQNTTEWRFMITLAGGGMIAI